MSVRIMADIWSHFPSGGSRLLVMLAFADYSNDAGEQIFPSMNALAERVRLTRSQARRVVHELIAEGWVEVVANEYGGAPGSTRHYRIIVEKLRETGSTNATPTGRTDARGSAHATGRTDARDGSHPCAQTGRTHATQTINEPSLTTKENIGAKTKTTRFKAPSVEEVATYCRERGNQVDAEHFVDHYTANGWKVGKNPMKDWRAAVRTWEKNQRTNSAGGNANAQGQRTGAAQRSETYFNNLKRIANE